LEEIVADLEGEGRGDFAGQRVLSFVAEAVENGRPPKVIGPIGEAGDDVKVNVLGARVLGELQDVLFLGAERLVQGAAEKWEKGSEVLPLFQQKVVERPAVAAQHDHEPAAHRGGMGVLHAPVLGSGDDGRVGEGN
jgi:hypothetical protein